MNKDSQKKNSILFYVLIGIVFTLPWFHGGEIKWQFNLFQIVILTALFILVINYQSNTTTHIQQTLIKNVRVPLLLLCALIGFTLIQSLSLPIAIIEFLAPKIAAYYRETSVALDDPEGLAALSIYKNETLQVAQNQASYLAIFIMTLVIVNSKRKALILVSTLFGTALLTAIHAFINYHTNGSFFYIESLYPWQATTHETIHGPLSYKNHYASFLIMTIPLGISLLFYSKIKKTRKKIAHVFNFILSKRGLLIGLCSFMFGILIFNTSRAALLAFTASALITICFCYYLNPKKFYLKKIGLSIIGVSAVLLLVLFSGLGDRLIERVSNYGENGRDILRTTASTVIQDHWLLGTGAGTYPKIQHVYKSELLNGHKMWQHAHNDYLELLSDQGIIGAGLLAVAILLLLYQLVLSIKNNNNSMRCIQVGCLCSILSILIHSFADFNFQLPVNTVYFYITLAIGIKVPLLSSEKTTRRRSITR